MVSYVVKKVTKTSREDILLLKKAVSRHIPRKKLGYMKVRLIIK